ncbi:MAG: N-acetylmuramoyl-L-alanine amidase [Oscillospiraceae bacterium]|nr:N-acetylmuramoyl-L-alanine amidase [Oscillospiraceae bacterium]
MKNHILVKLTPAYAIILVFLFLCAFLGDKAVTVMTEDAEPSDRVCIIIDAGHGGVDTGATSCTGVMESNINLEIALRLNDLLQLMGHKTKMIRTTDESIYTEGSTTIAAKKISDLKNRVQIVNEADNALLVSIHQNHFPVDKYRGAQVFYNRIGESEALAKLLQNNFVATLNPGSIRKAKKADGVYLMQNIQTTGILIECGFLSNPEEESLLRNAGYQKKLCCVIAATLSSFLKENAMT